MGAAADSSQPSPAATLQGLALKCREPALACEAAAPAWPREHARCIFIANYKSIIAGNSRAENTLGCYYFTAL